MSNSSNSSKGDGNTKHPPKSKTKQISPSIHWCFTLNNYTKKDITEISNNSSIDKYIFQEETGTNNTPHLQGYIRFLKKTRPKKLFNQKIHWEKCRNIKASIEYCRKKETRTGEVFTNIPPPYSIDIELYDWQIKICKILDEKPQDRKIHWIWESTGNVGKTTFAKWLFLNYPNVVVLGGKACDMKHQIIQYHQTNKIYPKTILIDLPRSFNTGYLSYTGIEEIKNMFFFSPKYEGGMVCHKQVHVIIFSNEEPNFSKMSLDKWIIMDLNPKIPKKIEEEEIEDYM